MTSNAPGLLGWWVGLSVFASTAVIPSTERTSWIYFSIWAFHLHSTTGRCSSVVLLQPQTVCLPCLSCRCTSLRSWISSFLLSRSLSLANRVSRAAQIPQDGRWSGVRGRTC